MPNLKEIRNRIQSVGSTMQITSAMKMVSAAKLKRAQDAVTQMRPYANKLKDILENVSSSLDLSENVFAEKRATGKTLIVGITSNRGLCGGFNNNVIKRVSSLVENDYKDDNVKVLCLGKKIKDVFKRTENYFNYEGLENVENVFGDLTYENVSSIAETLMSIFTAKEFDRIVLVYNRSVNAATQSIENEQYLPVNTSADTQKESISSDYIFEPSKEEIILDLIPNSLKLQLFKAIRDSFAAEHGARMTAMHKATDNATEMKKELTLFYNKARQASITSEILEIVAGAEALGG